MGQSLIPDEVISEIRERVDMIALVGDYVRLKRRGGNHVGLCPFHSEKTPSFSVNPGNRYYYCFGCQASGDPFSFVMQVEGLSFPEAARALAERAGVQIPEPEAESAVDAAQRRARARREQLGALMEEACRFYERCLGERAGQPGRDELAHRGVTDEVAKTFRLGCAPHAWDALSSHLERKGASLELAEEVGLLARRRDGSGHYDRFRGRLMFPIRELSGQVVAFSGRALRAPGDAAGGDEPKYINSPESALYTKGAVLFGLHEGRVPIRRHGWALVCEGNFDLLALHQAGFQNAVAPLGTAFTGQQAKLIGRFASRVTLLFDGDAAGVKAARAAYPLLRQHQLAGRVARMPAGEDPDSFLRSRGVEALRGLVDASPGIVEFLIDCAAEDGRSGGAAERASLVEGLGPVLAAVDNAVEIEMYVERIAQRFGVSDLTGLRGQLRRGALREREGRKRPSTPETATSEKSTLAPSPSRVKLPKLQTELLGVLLERPTLFASQHASRLEGQLTSPELRDVFRAAAQAVQETGDLNISTLLSALDAHVALPWVKQRLATSMYQDRDDVEEVLEKGIPLLAKQNIERELPTLDRAISEARRMGDDERAVGLTRQRDALRRSAYEQLRRQR